MADRMQLWTVPGTRSFADALATGLIARYPGMALARGLVLLPNNRGKRAVTDAFVRASGGGLLLPRLVAIGDPALGEGAGAALDPADDAPLPPAIAPLARRMALTRLLHDARPNLDAAEAVRLAGELARTLDQLLVEEVPPSRLAEFDATLSPELSAHWRKSLDLFELLLARWPAELAKLGAIDAAERRRLLLDRTAERWRRDAPPGFVCVAGVTDPAPAVARLLRCVAGLPDGSVVMAGLGVDLSDEEWDALGPHAPDPVTGLRRRPLETHPQYGLKLLLDRMGVNRRETRVWPYDGGPEAPAARARAIAHALAPAELTARWSELSADRRRLEGVTAAEFATPAAEAQGIALALREALETPGKTAALVTPDRALARRVAAHLARWEVGIDDTAGRPLSILPPGTLLHGLAEAAEQGFAPLPLLALLKHPLVRSGDERGRWLAGARSLDRALRGPRPAPGLDGIDAHLADRSGRDGRLRALAASWWPEARALLRPIATLFASEARPLGELLAGLRETIFALGGDAPWTGAAGRAAAELLSELEAQADGAPVDPASIAPILRTLMDEVAVRPPQGGHPRLAIYGLIEARLQTADLFVLGGLNEGAWPGTPAPDPWLAPRVRAELGLPGLDARIGVAAHDFGQGLGAPEVLLTRSQRDAKGPALPSRFWLRLEALAGRGLARAEALTQWTEALDAPGEFAPSKRPAPMPKPSLRPKVINVTEVDRLKADPFAFYAQRVLGLRTLEPVDADPSAAWRGTAVHEILEAWARQDECAPDALRARAERMLADERTHPLMRALWWPRLEEAIDWIARKIADNRKDGREVLRAEGSGRVELAGVVLQGRYDRIDRAADGSLALVDYKTGKPPSTAAVRDGYSLQLGLLGIIAEAGGFEGVEGVAGGFEYWSLGRARDGFGYVATPCDPDGKRDRIVTADFTTVAERNFTAVAGKWLTGEEPFTAKLHPEYAPYADYDQLMRRDEWYGREVLP